MTFNAIVSNLQADIAFMQRYIEIRVATGFNDMQRLVEVTAASLFKHTHGYNLENANLIKTNFPAIDLCDDIQGVSVQVTINATPAKVKKTIAAFEKANLHTKYGKLYIFGFCSAGKNASGRSYCEVIGIPSLLNIIINKSSNDDLAGVCEAIRRHTDYSRFHPWDDLNCLKILLNHIDRDAIKHRMSCEGNINDMTTGLREVNELISKGSVGKKEKSKCIDDFEDEEITVFMREIRKNISEIISIVNRSRQQGSEFVDIKYEDLKRIDEIKSYILDLSNETAKKKGLDIQITMP